MDVSEMKVGEIYNLNGRRGRLEELGTFDGGDSHYLPYSPDDPYARAVFSVGRSFERKVELVGNRWRHSVISQVDETWEQMKERKKAEKAHRKEADEISEELRKVISAMGMNGGWTDGRSVTIYGDLSQMRKLTAILAAHVEDDGTDSEALAELLG